jgi:hypothetical protein
MKCIAKTIPPMIIATPMSSMNHGNDSDRPAPIGCELYVDQGERERVENE